MSARNPMNDVELGIGYLYSRKEKVDSGDPKFKDKRARFKEIVEICKLCKEGNVNELKNRSQPYGNFAQGLFSGHTSETNKSFFGEGPDEIGTLTPLRIAAEFGRKEVLQFLVKGQDVDVNEGLNKEEIYEPPKRKVNTTALHLAATFGHADCVEFLIQNGAIISLLDGHGDTAIHCAARYHKKSTCVRIDGKEEHECALKVFVDTSLKNAEDNSHQLDGGVNKSLKVDAGNFLHRLNVEGNRPLHVCALWDDCSGLKLLLDAEVRHAKALAEKKHVLLQANAGAPGSATGCLCCTKKQGNFVVKAASKAKFKALNARNRDGQTATYIAALRNNQGAKQFLLSQGATWKEGLLKTTDRMNSLKVFAVLAVLFVLLIAPIILSEMQQTKQGEELAQVCLKLGYPYNGREYWNCRCGAFAYYGGNVLGPNAFIICGVFFFKLLQFLFEKQFVPACDFISFFFFHKHNDDSTSLTTIKGRWLAATKQTLLGRECAACAHDQGKAAPDDPNNGNRYSTSSKESFFSCLFKLCGDPDEGEANGFEHFYLGLVSYLYNEEKSREAKLILEDWRRSKYKSILNASPNFRGASFSLQPNYIFLYVQILWTVVSVLAITMETSKSDEVWMRSKTPSRVSDAFLSYTNFYGQVVNSACTNTVFSLFKMAVFDQRFGQLWTAHRNLPTLFLRILWPVFILLPIFLLLPPFFSHIIPGFFLFAWIFIPLFFVYLLLLRMWNLLHGEKPERRETERLSYFGAVISCFMISVDKVLSYFGEAISCFMICVLRIKDWSEKDNPHPSLLQTYFYMFFLEIFARYVFILVFQLTFDFSTIFFLGHNGDSFSQDYYYATLLNPSSTATNVGDNHGTYLNSIARVNKWRSQSLCFLEEGLDHARWPSKLSFF